MLHEARVRDLDTGGACGSKRPRTCSSLHGIGEFRIEARAPLEISCLAPHEVLLEPQAVGICGSDMHYWGSASIGGRDIPFPAVHATRFGGVMGHECGALVVGVGAGVTRVRVGDRVAVEAGVPCGGCSFGGTQL